MSNVGSQDDGRSRVAQIVAGAVLVTAAGAAVLLWPSACERLADDTCEAVEVGATDCDRFREELASMPADFCPNALSELDDAEELADGSVSESKALVYMGIVADVKTAQLEP